MQSVIEWTRRFAPTPASVLIVGESGTGKELTARALHRGSGRPGPFVAVNCGAIAPDLLASQMFGHERGSFTGATTRHTGYFEHAHRGTLFLDEITEMPPPLQVYLLRARAWAGSAPTPIDARVIAATNRDPMSAIRSGQLREDLYYRLADLILELPPLRERGTERLLLAQLFVDRLNAQQGTRKRLAPQSARTLFQHDWPGNVRELRSATLRAFLLSDDSGCVWSRGAARRAMTPSPPRAIRLHDAWCSMPA